MGKKTHSMNSMQDVLPGKFHMLVGNVLSFCRLPRHFLHPASFLSVLCLISLFFFLLPEISLSYREEEDCCSVLPNKSCAVRGDCNFELC